VGGKHFSQQFEKLGKETGLDGSNLARRPLSTNHPMTERLADCDFLSAHSPSASIVGAVGVSADLRDPAFNVRLSSPPSGSIGDSYVRYSDPLEKRRGD
jgi:hypothetical protein